jgi:hypothetical protein
MDLPVAPEGCVGGTADTDELSICGQGIGRQVLSAMQRGSVTQLFVFATSRTA